MEESPGQNQTEATTTTPTPTPPPTTTTPATTTTTTTTKPENNEPKITSQPSESSASSSSSSSWWNSLVKTAKEKSANAIELMRTDLAEFKSTMSADTTRLVSTLTNVDVDAAATNTTGTLLNSLSSLSTALGLDTLISGMAGVVGEEDESGGVAGSSSTSAAGAGERKLPGRVVVSPPGNVHERFQAELKQMQADEATYLNLNAFGTSEFDEWSKSFNPDEVKSTISDLLIDNSAMRLIYSQLVPAQMSNEQFWSRYFFRYHQLEEDYKKRVQLLEKASKTSTETSNRDEANDWDDEDSPTQTEEIKPTDSTTNDTTNTTTTTTTTTTNTTTTTTHEQEKPTKSTVSISKSSEENDDWEKLSDLDQIDQQQQQKLESKKEEKPEDKSSGDAAAAVAAAAVVTSVVVDADAEANQGDSSKLSEVEVPRNSAAGDRGKAADNDWEDWDE